MDEKDVAKWQPISRLDPPSRCEHREQQTRRSVTGATGLGDDAGELVDLALRPTKGAELCRRASHQLRGMREDGERRDAPASS